MRFAYGVSRFVVLTPHFAIKVARFPFWKLLSRGLYWSLKGQLISRPRQVYGSVPLGILKYLLVGLMANSDEYRFYREYPDLPLAPTLFTFFGLINIQVRGEVVQNCELSDCPFQDLFTDPGLDLQWAKQFCRINGEIVLADYGNPKVQQAIRKKYRRELAFA